MSLAETYGPLTEMGEVEDATYEVRGADHPIVYVYVKVGERYVEKCTQQGDLSGYEVAELLAHEIKRAA